jgi:putative endonuclease
MITVYVLFSPSHGRFYRGITNDVQRRLAEHNAGRVYATARYVPWEMILQESFEDHASARAREKYLQSAAGRRWLREYRKGKQLFSDNED